MAQGDRTGKQRRVRRVARPTEGDRRATPADRVDAMTVRTPLTPGRLSPWRPVPPHIPRPEYVGKAGPTPWRGSHVQTLETIEKMRVAGRIAGQALQLAGEHCKPGVTTDEVDRVVHEFLIDQNAYPSTLGYKGFPKSCCTSLNEVICHGIPDSTVLQDGDIINVDVTAYIAGVHGDTDATFCVGDVSDDVRLLVERTREALLRGIRAVAPGRQINVVGRVIESYARRFGYGVVRDFTGHGIGESFHSGLYVPHYDAPQPTDVMEPGMTFTIEPMITLGTHEYDMWDDGWTVVTKDRRWTAQFEHTILVTEDGAEILTLP
jgi:methionyl aminopeptidase